jgi:hypothetical protein
MYLPQWFIFPYNYLKLEIFKPSAIRYSLIHVISNTRIRQKYRRQKIVSLGHKSDAQ